KEDLELNTSQAKRRHLSLTHHICTPPKHWHGMLRFVQPYLSQLLLAVKLCLVGLIFLSTDALALDKITDIQFWHAPEKTRMVIDLTAGASYKIFSLDNPDRLVIDLKDTDGN